MAVTVADCVPVFVAHPSGAAAALHSGWRGTAAGITSRAIELLVDQGFAAHDLRLHCGPAICGKCYEVSADVYGQLTGRQVTAPAPVDLRALIADQARALGVREISVSPLCTRCDNDRFYSHRAGDAGRQLGVIRAG
jgi:YfiH family protein